MVGASGNNSHPRLYPVILTVNELPPSTQVQSYHRLPDRRVRGTGCNHDG
jgi:hypothetical protein